ncbi:MAG: cation transporter [Firmicutes bacterium]|nr:cation transporter [Bacillota bacterium]HQD38996.1 cation diffusion facilitator family transporter [Bacillota bacterium]
MTTFLLKLFVKDYKNTDDPEVRERYGTFASWVGIFSNILLFGLKLMAGLVFNSIAIVADAVNNLSDSGSALIALFGFKLSSKPADAEHPYGHARMEYVSGLLISFVVFVLGLQLIKGSVEKILKPQAIEFGWLFLVVLIFSIGMKLWQSLFFRRLGDAIDSPTLLATSVDSRNDVLSTTAVLVAAVLTHLTGFNLDGYMGLGVAVFIVISGVKLVQETIDPLLGTVPTKELVDRIYNKILSYEHIEGLHDLEVHTYGPGKCFASVHCEVSSDLDVMVGHDVIDNIERDFLEEEGIHLVIHLDPITKDEETEALKQEVEKIVTEISPELSIHDFRVVKGVTHSNLIFDTTVPFGFKYSDEKLIKLISEKIRELNPTYRTVIRIDRDYLQLHTQEGSK